MNKCLLLLALATTCYATCRTLETYDRDSIPKKVLEILNRTAIFRPSPARRNVIFLVRKVKYYSRVLFIVKVTTAEYEEYFLEIPKDKMDRYLSPPLKEYKKYELHNCPLKQRKGNKSNGTVSTVKP
ncbi:unnamed protein product [Nippostrongylus brasiliensis]|uniref:Conserved secreted protein n=1 Tax=Nippostrongylus brasiliensis TaxID=27835 RepID=A0A0N4YNM1_NIPBR|nr:unnamed protein product [Nippostrongylus brasiliensis]